MSKFKAGDKVTYCTGVKVGEVIATHGDRLWVHFGDNSPRTYREDELRPSPKRYVVEVRPVKVGEKIIGAFGNWAVSMTDSREDRAVIVEEL